VLNGVTAKSQVFCHSREQCSAFFFVPRQVISDERSTARDDVASLESIGMTQASFEFERI